MFGLEISLLQLEMVAIPPTAIVATQQDPNSPTILTSIEDAHEMLRGGRRARRQSRTVYRKLRNTRRTRRRRYFGKK